MQTTYKINDFNNSSHNEEHLNVVKSIKMFLFLKVNKWPKQNETCCSMHTRPCTYMCSVWKHVYGTITVFKTMLQH
mgnify:CR=1 FL=1